VSPIFRHGRLRLYLLKLLDEAPRHGYEVIRLLQDRFMGVYSPSPGTIYPRLARLEDDGLVTHDEVDGKKVYRITEKGREEIRGRLDDLAELEDELTESVRDIAREVSEDVRDTVRSLREEITSAARDIRRDGRARPGAGERDAGTGDGRSAGELPGDTGDNSDTRSNGAAGSDRRAGTAGRAAADEDSERAADDARRIRDEARQARDDIRDAFRSRRGGGSRPGGARPGGAGSGGPASGGARSGGARSGGARSGGARSGSGRPDWAGFAGRGGWADWGGLPAGLDRLASDFARDLSHVAGHAGDLGEGALGDLKDILADALTRIRDEVFTPAGDAGEDTASVDTASGDTAEDSRAAGTEAADRRAADSAAAHTAAAGTAAADTGDARPDDGAWAAGTQEAGTHHPETRTPETPGPGTREHEGPGST
jgi:DNA-binding PadR family transcriptional regulator